MSATFRLLNGKCVERDFSDPWVELVMWRNQLGQFTAIKHTSFIDIVISRRAAELGHIITLWGITR